MKLGRHADALVDAQAAVAADGGYAKGYLRRALAHQALGGLEDAVRDFEKVRDPTLTLSWVPVLLCRQQVKMLAGHAASMSGSAACVVQGVLACTPARAPARPHPASWEDGGMRGSARASSSHDRPQQKISASDTGRRGRAGEAGALGRPPGGSCERQAWASAAWRLPCTWMTST